MLRATKVSQEFIDAARAHWCDVCEATEPPPSTNKVSRPEPRVLSHDVVIDVVEGIDVKGTYFDILNAVDYGTTCEQSPLRERQMSTESHHHPTALMILWRAGLDLSVGHNSSPLIEGRSADVLFNQTLPKKGVRIKPAALEGPEQIGQVQLRNHTSKLLLIKVI